MLILVRTSSPPIKLLLTPHICRRMHLRRYTPRFPSRQHSSTASHTSWRTRPSTLAPSPQSRRTLTKLKLKLGMVPSSTLWPKLPLWHIRRCTPRPSAPATPTPSSNTPCLAENRRYRRLRHPAPRPLRRTRANVAITRDLGKREPRNGDRSEPRAPMLRACPRVASARNASTPLRSYPPRTTSRTYQAPQLDTWPPWRRLGACIRFKSYSARASSLLSGTAGKHPRSYPSPARSRLESGHPGRLSTQTAWLYPCWLASQTTPAGRGPTRRPSRSFKRARPSAASHQSAFTTGAATSPLSTRASPLAAGRR